MGINAPGGYRSTIRDAQYRRWSRDSYYDGYRGYGPGADAYSGAYDGSYEGSYEGSYDAARETDEYREDRAYREGLRGGFHDAERGHGRYDREYDYMG